MINKTCQSPTEVKGCDLYVTDGCRCSSIRTCENSTDQTFFQYSSERDCFEDWTKIKALWHENCLKAKCDVIFHPKCPADSKLILTEPPLPPECCQKPGHCVCDQKFCHDSVHRCPRDHDLVLVKKASNKPGDCCPQYKCLPPAEDCSKAYCPPELFSECPGDSYRPGKKYADDRTTTTSSKKADDNNDTDNVTALDYKYKLVVRRNKRTKQETYDVQQGRLGRCCPSVEPCVCKPDHCTPVVCPDGYHLEVISKGTGVAGSCCDKVRCLSIVSNNVFCEHKGQVYEDGTKWKPDPCSECFCKGGLIFCKKYECPETNWCSLVNVPEHECCPVCIGCKSEDGEFHNFTDQWQKDECTTCTCGLDGAILCHEQMCTVECDNPVKVPGRCCPVCENPLVVQIPFVCPSIELCNLMCEHGMKRDRMGCFFCECETKDSLALPETATAFATTRSLFASKTTTTSTDDDDTVDDVYCNVLNEKVCNRKCGHGYERDDRGCLICKCKSCPQPMHCYKSCLYGFEVNDHGCPVCRCRGSSTPAIVHVSTATKDTTTADFTCKSSSSVRDHGEWWFDGCRYCYCDEGREFCSILACPNSDSSCFKNYVVDETGCLGNNATKLQTQLVCHSPGTGRSYVEGEFWSLDLCVQCTCHIGHVLCHEKTCAPSPCSRPQLLPGQCCHSCGRWNETSETEKKPQKSGKHCTVGGETYSSGSQWKNGICKSCRCSDGRVECFELSCDDRTTSNCAGRLLHFKNTCCPVCLDSPKFVGLCQYKNVTYDVGEHWRDGLCRNCTCRGANDILCTQYECPKCPTGEDGLPTAAIVSLSSSSSWSADQCCPVCAFEPKNRFLWTPSNDRNNIPSIYSRDSSESSVNAWPALVAFCAFGLISVVFIVALLAVWLRRRHQRGSFVGQRCRSMSETSYSSSARSDPILKSIFCGHIQGRYKTTVGATRDSPTALLAKCGSSTPLDQSQLMTDSKISDNSAQETLNNNESCGAEHQQRRSLLISSPYDSDGGSTALTSDAGSTGNI